MNEIHLKMIEGEFEREPQDTHSQPSALVLDEQGNPKPKMLRVMTADQVKERIDLQVANTAQAIRTRVLKDVKWTVGYCDANGNPVVPDAGFRHA